MGRVGEHPDLPAELHERYNRLSASLGSQPEEVECSLVQSCDSGAYPGLSHGHIITIPDWHDPPRQGDDRTRGLQARNRSSEEDHGPADHDRFPLRLPDRWQWWYGDWFDKRNERSVIPARSETIIGRPGILRSRGQGIRAFAFVWCSFALLVNLLPAKDSRGNSAQANYDHARSLFERGFLAMSQEESASKFQLYRDSNPNWASRFQLLEANSMLLRGMYEDALRVLSSYSDSNASNDAVEELAIEAVALTRQQQTAAANAANAATLN